MSFWWMATPFATGGGGWYVGGPPGGRSFKACAWCTAIFCRLGSGCICCTEWCCCCWCCFWRVCDPSSLNVSVGITPSFRCFPKRNICPMPFKSPGFLLRAFCLPSFNELWNGPCRLIKPPSVSLGASSKNQCFRGSKGKHWNEICYIVEK